MTNKILVLLVVALVNTATVFSSKADSLRIDSLLNASSERSYKTNSERLLFFAKSFIGTPYKGGTLDAGENETLIVRTDSLDCTTYVEAVLALYLSSFKDNPGYDDFSESLIYIRYRGGVIDGYASRLHYFSDWASDNEKKGILREVTQEGEHDVRLCSLNYMTTHSDLYRQLKDNDSLISEISKVEKSWIDYKMPYIPKNVLNSSKADLPLEDGDILALTTNISGLDVLHLGFALWIDGRLHLLHASSLHGKVIIDTSTIFDYLKNRNKHTGIRVLRVK
ncbi:N-acetylmuramoyl-L-alanine amidase-like domain-containing protein [uncultured Bacteroides sp.]|uniref:N-acetylmuramoyl-L-alanine amidase-like domain-containing protein n=1 Tax=uncultured Bacteroides sp. TaxID=162156 RepID=UPI0025F30835|nr:N-acetylmuramoyl-L-alanine amidase-like domain-containing protein [uncultured Bacteroides sp.]